MTTDVFLSVWRVAVARWILIFTVFEARLRLRVPAFVLFPFALSSELCVACVVAVAAKQDVGEHSAVPQEAAKGGKR